MRHRLSARLAGGGFAADHAEVGVQAADPLLRGSAALVVVIGHIGDPQRAATLAAADAGVAAGVRVVAIAYDDDVVITPSGQLANVVRLGDDPNQVIAGLVASLVTPSVLVPVPVPGVNVPIGVAAWTGSQVIVACEDSGQLVSVDVATGRAMTLLYGLIEPHGVSVDRRSVLVTSKGSNSVMCGELVDGRFAPRREIGTPGSQPRLHRPHHADAHAGTMLVVDTDAHRVLRAAWQTGGDLGRFSTLSTQTSLSFPCGAAFFGDWILLADTFHDRIVAVHQHGRADDVTFEFPCPVQIAVAQRGLVVVAATDGVHLVRLVQTADTLEAKLLMTVPCGGNQPLRSPFGVAVDRDQRLFIADRGRGVLWAAELAELVRDGHGCR